jgi:hypothetical protein
MGGMKPIPANVPGKLARKAFNGSLIDIQKSELALLPTSMTGM